MAMILRKHSMLNVAVKNWGGKGDGKGIRRLLDVEEGLNDVWVLQEWVLKVKGIRTF